VSRILVTGGAGYIGSHTCKALAAAGHTPVVVDNLSEGHREFVKWGRFYQLDVRETPQLIEVFDKEDIDAVIHFAASAYVGESMTNPQKYYDNNFAGVLSLLDAMQQTGVQSLVFSSTCAVYGEPAQLPITIDASTDPINPYGRSKLISEQAIRDCASATSLRGVILRYFNAAGCDLDGEIGERHDPETHLIPNVINAALQRSDEFQLYGDDYPTPDGTCIRDYVHVNDLASAHIKAIEFLNMQETRSKDVWTFNLGTQSGVSVKEVIDAVERQLSCQVPVKILPRRLGDPPSLVADSHDTYSRLGWRPVHSDLEAIVKSAIQWSKLERSKH